MHPDYFRAVLALTHHPHSQVTTGPAASNLAHQTGFYFTPISGAVVLVILVIAVAAAAGRALLSGN